MAFAAPFFGTDPVHRTAVKGQLMAAKKTTAQSADQYTKPELREQIKTEVLAGDKGGKPGQWSARKAQLVAHEYEARGGGYKHERTKAQEHLHEWTAEHWQTSDGEPAERDGVTTRYLPAEAWEKLSPGEKRATNAKKIKGSKDGKQFVGNTRAASTARREAEMTLQKADQASGTRNVPRAKKGSGSVSSKKLQNGREVAPPPKSVAAKRNQKKT